MKQLVILGSTGSIGKQALQVVDAYPGQFRVLALAAGKNLDLLVTQIQKYQPLLVSVADTKTAAELTARLGPKLPDLVYGVEGAEYCAALPGTDLVISAMVGACGLRPTLAAIRAGHDVALANKEVLVAAGELVMYEVCENKVQLLPIDSEHAAIHQCLRSSKRPATEIQRILITGSGGPFRDTPLAQLSQVTPAQALKHPNWVMGDKITIDSATLMNKGLEMIEAHHLFGVPGSNIEVWIHRQSMVHSLVEFSDGNIMAQLGPPDMRLPLQYCMTYPDRLAAPWPRLKLSDLAQLSFEAPDFGRFSCLALAYAALIKAGTAPAVLNAANEVAVQQFLQGHIRFTDIPMRIEDALARVTWMAKPTLDDILLADAEARQLMVSQV